MMAEIQQRETECVADEERIENNHITDRYR
jgi:hypothetical protein